MERCEQWRAVPGHEGRYEVSDLGRVRSLRRCIVLATARASRYGHRSVSLSVAGERRTARVHHLVLEAFVGPRPAGLETRHLNGDPSDNRLANLTYGTPSENQRDRVRHGNHFHAVKSHCRRGHRYTDENTYVRPDGRGRSCRECKRENDRRYRSV